MSIEQAKEILCFDAERRKQDLVAANNNNYDRYILGLLNRKLLVNQQIVARIEALYVT